MDFVVDYHWLISTFENMNWTDSNGLELNMGDAVLIDNIIHVIELHNIGGKNRMVFIPYLIDTNILLEYHFLYYKNAKKRTITKIENYGNKLG